MKQRNRYWEVYTNNGGVKIEDHIRIFKAKSMAEAIKMYHDYQGYLTIHGEVIECREIYYVFDVENHDIK